MIEPKHIEVDGRTYIISKFPSWEGREIATEYPITSLPKIGDHVRNDEIRAKLMGYVAVPLPEGGHVMLSAKALINKYVPSWETLMKIEWEMMQYNCTFLASGRISTFFQDLALRVPEWITKILTGFLESSSQKTKRPSKN